MLRIGYVRLRDASAYEDTALLKAAGCQVVRAEEPGAEGLTLASILDFMGPGDQLVVSHLDRLAATGRGLLDALERLEARGASLGVLRPALSSTGAGGVALRAALEAVAELERTASHRRRRPAAPAVQEMNTLCPTAQKFGRDYATESFEAGLRGYTYFES